MAAALTATALPAQASAVSPSSASAPASAAADSAATPVGGAVAPDGAHAPGTGAAEPVHDLKGPLTDQVNAERAAAVQALASGEAEVERSAQSRRVRLDDGKYVELGREATDRIFVILAEFDDQVTETYGGTPGPQHNEIAEPDRSVDNSTIWQADYNQAHYQDLYFAQDGHSVATYFERQSSGRYSVEGTVTDWVRVPYNEARYGNNDCGSNVCATVWDLVRDAANQWVADREAAGATPEQIRAELAEFDVWDRYDHDADGNFDESDGYIDHFQIVHAGEDESAGGGAEGEDAIWAHRWYAYGTSAGSTGPEGNLLGGTQVGDTGIWIGDYTMQPENGGLGVFVHEYGHDLGLPDLYDTAGGENSTGFWSLMSSGSWLNDGGNEIGDLPGDLTAWDKLQLGWLDFDTAQAATRSRHTLGYSEYNTRLDQALVVELPEKEVTTEITVPAEGSAQWWSGSGDDLSNTLTRTVDLTGAATAQLSLKGWWEIEAGYDYLYTEVSTNGGTSWTALDGTAGGRPLGRDSAGRPALDGTSGGYTDLVFPLDAYAGQSVLLRFRYTTDGGVAEKGFTADAISITADGTEILADGAEGDDAGWTPRGFSRVGATITDTYPQFYIVENRQYVSYDETLELGPYNFGWANTRPDWVERFPYQNGMVVWLWDTSQLDNNVSEHPGQGLVLPVDAHPRALRWSDGTVMRNRIQSYDSAFSFERTDGFTLHRNGVPTRVPSQRGVSVFDDHNGVYYDEANPGGSVRVPDTGTVIKLTGVSPSGDRMTIEVGPARR
uniref:immune inhibitor A domain-containing protein n=1 Tax=Allostreptomyces psammosilenae TaxID=1892865 RepID=UPI0028A68864|nr:immune inhibitor A domain-containing protein [Allostreptomyces psammosilenae]